MSVVRLIIATRSSGPPASGNIIKEMPGLVASGTPYIRVKFELHALNTFKKRFWNLFTFNTLSYFSYHADL